MFFLECLCNNAENEVLRVPRFLKSFNNFSRKIREIIFSMMTCSDSCFFSSQRTGSKVHRSGQIWELLEGGQLSQGTSTLFRSLPILRSGPSPPNLRSKMTTQSLNRTHFQSASGAAPEEYSQAMKAANSGLPEDPGGTFDSYHLNSRVLQDKIIALDRQRLLSCDTKVYY